MPRSKRARVVHTSKTKKQTKQEKEKKIESLRNNVEKSKYVYLLSYDSVKTSPLQEIRKSLTDSQIYLGKNTLAQVALGTSPQNEIRDGISNLSNKLKGKRALLLSIHPKSVILKQLAEAEESHDIKFTMDGLWSDKTGFIDLSPSSVSVTSSKNKVLKGKKNTKASVKRKQLSSQVNEEEMEESQEQSMEDEDENETNLALN